ncbi:MAG: xanthine dehydrogenase family protein subunit M [Chloroflexi bacterium]|nr:xanthine dehydrogenase family protein subunit M [Chloroflexota bacterium]MCL5076135.1 xanthine dehydrogenase family protein subunit M [Chloroflexota bacterium]
MRFECLEPHSLEEALSLLAEYGGKAKPLAGGTDLLVDLKLGRLTIPYIVNLKRIPGLGRIEPAAGGLGIGALATVGAVEILPLIQRRWAMLAQAAHCLGSPQVRNIATVAGNLCRAAPSADMAPVLLALDASVEIASLSGRRVVPLEKFFRGPGATILEPQELLTAIYVSDLPPGTAGVYLKLGPRRAMDLAIVGVAALLRVQEGVCRGVRIALGAVAPTPLWARRAEEVVEGRSLDDDVLEMAGEVAAEESRPISDIRASATYRRAMVKVLVKRALSQAWESAQMKL